VEYLNGKVVILASMLGLYPLIVIPNPIDYFYFPRYIVLVIVSMIALLFIAKNLTKITHRALIPLGLFILFAFLSTILAIEPMKAWTGSIRYSGFSTYLFCIILFFLAYSNNNVNLKRLIDSMIICASLVSFTALLQHFGLNIVPHELVRATYASFGTMANPNFLGTYTAFILPASIISYMRYSKRIYLLSTAMIYAGLIVCVTRGAWITFGIAFIYLLYYYLKIFNKRKLILHVTLVLFITTVFLLSTSDGIILNRILSISNEVTSAIALEDSAGSNRMLVWKKVVELISEHWLFGIGPDNLNLTIVKNETNFFVDKAHNIFLEMAVTMGIFAMLSYMAFLSFFLRMWKGEQEIMFSTMILSYIIQGQFNIDVVMIMPIFWIVLGLSLANMEKHKGSKWTAYCVKS